MPKWQKDATEFNVGVSYNETRGYQACIPKPVARALGEPRTITFKMKGGKITVSAGE